MSLTFTVYGKTATKGSTRSFVTKGRIVTLADNRNLGAWTQAAKWAAKTAGAVLVPKPRGLVVSVTFQFVRPPSALKRLYPTVKPDIDKLIRAVLDALTGIAYEDDAQVLSLTALKTYGDTELCVIDVFEMRE